MDSGTQETVQVNGIRSSFADSLIQRIARIAAITAAVFVLVMASLPHPPAVPGLFSDKLQHFAAFATLGVLSAYGYGSKSAMRLFVVLAAFAGLIELLQAIPALRRDPDYLDFFVGAAAAALAILATRRLTSPRAASRAQR